MPWYSPPTRREISLVLFSFTIFILFYNLEFSLTSDALAGTWPDNEGADSASEKVDWDGVIYGNWTLEEIKVAENAHKQALDNTNPTVPTVAVSFRPQVFGSVGVNDGILDWGDNVPPTTVLTHVPGYTTMDNVFILNGTLFIVTDDPAFPPLESIASSPDGLHVDWQILSSAQAKETLGPFGGLIHGVSWLVTDPSPNNYTFFSLWRTYSAPNTSLSPDALTLPPPRRIFYPNVPTFMGEPTDPNGPVVERQRSPSGFHPFLAKAALPTLGLMYQEDWVDYALLHAPFLMKRVVVADQGAASRARTDVPAFAVPLIELEGSKGWWEPIRRNVARSLGVPEQAPKKTWLTKTIVTYLSRQDAAHGPKLGDADHGALIEGLKTLGSGYTVHVVSSSASWVERMTAIAQSTIVIGVYGAQMADSVYVPPSSRATVMEVFPPGVFIRDTEMAVGALDGVKYVAWSEAREYGVGALPPVAPPDEAEMTDIPIDVSAMMEAIRRIG